jgi:hypothetical protein
MAAFMLRLALMDLAVVVVGGLLAPKVKMEQQHEAEMVVRVLHLLFLGVQ